ncbi:MAG: hypothetical protein GY790_22270 [Bacteroidetes bacterium]|nr:hypothetical protein [Bacteroidota bacterium]
MKNLLFCTVLLILVVGCQKEPRGLIDIKILADKETFNPLLEPDVTGTVSILGIYSNGKNEMITDGDIVLRAETKLASGDVEVVKLEGNKIIPREGGIGTIEAVVVKDGKTFMDEKDIVVRPFYREYHKTLVLKLWMGIDVVPKGNQFITGGSDSNDPSRMCTFKEAFDVIRKTDKLTRGIPKIIYLEGWEKGGFDRLCPAWNIVNPKLKREEDSTALESLRWLIREAKQYNTTVSLHIDMVLARPDSPLWDEYVKKDIVGRDANGKIILLGEFSYLSYTREWEEGMAQKRIDQLIEMIPELVDGHTIHVDNLITYWKPENRPLSPWHAKPENGGIDMYRETETIRKIFKYWMERGFDVTGEGILWAHPPGEGFYGLQGYSYWARGTEHSMKVPERLSARGATTRAEDMSGVAPGDFRIGTSMHGEDIWLKDKENLSGFLEQFCTMALPWYYLSQHERLALIDETVYYSEGLTAGDVDGRKTIKKGDYVLVENDNVFVEAKWKEQEIIAYSKEGYSSRQWVMPESWEGVKSVDLYEISIDGLEPVESGRKIENGRLELSLDMDQAVSIVPQGFDNQAH